MSGLAGRIAARLDALEAGARGRLRMIDAVPAHERAAYAATEWGLPEADLSDPAAVLRLVDGLRAVVRLHPPDDRIPAVCGACGNPHYWAPKPWPCPTLLGLAAALGVEVGE